MEKNLLVKDILECANGKLVIGNELLECKNYSIDTRNLSEADVFIGIKGNNFDGNLFWKEALKNDNIKVVVVQDINFEKEDLSVYTDKTIISVKNTLEALQNIASAKRDLYDIPLIAVTGSVGKTSTKDIIASVLSKKYKTLKTLGNFNNHIGMPLSLLRLKDHEAAVIEMGMNNLGEISLLSKIAKPTIAVITNVGTSHIGNLGSRENILKAKLEILDGMKEKLIVINNDNDLLHDWYNKNKDNINIKTFGIQNTSDCVAKDIVISEQSSTFTCCIKNDKFEVCVPVSGEHFLLNALSSVVIGDLLNISKENIVEGIKNIELTTKRMELTKLKNGVNIINDSYNASLESNRAALKFLGQLKQGRKIAVLGDMFELGEFSNKLHKEVGKEVVKNKVDYLIVCGENAKLIAEEANSLGLNKENIYIAENLDDIETKVKSMAKENDNILIKASNGMKFFVLAENLTNYFEMC